MSGTSRSGGNRTASDDNFPQDGMPVRPDGWGRSGHPEGKVWKKLMGEIPSDLLRRIDVYQLRILCTLIVMETRLSKLCSADPEDLKLGRSYLAVTEKIAKLSSMFGLSPIDRRRIRMKPPEIKSDADEWAAG